MALSCRELSRFIASGRLHCRIDKVAGVVETNRPDSKNYLYQVSKKKTKENLQLRTCGWSSCLLACLLFCFCLKTITFLLQSSIKQGDLLLNRVQKLSRVINIWPDLKPCSYCQISFSITMYWLDCMTYYSYDFNYSPMFIGLCDGQLSWYGNKYN